MKKNKLSLATAFTASMLVLSALFSCAENSDSLSNVDVPEELTQWNAAEVLGEDYKKRDTIKIPRGVVRIEDEAFYGCDAQTIIIPSTVTRIGDSSGNMWGNKAVFRECASLQSIEIPESVTYIGTYAFYGCKSLKTVTLNEGLRIIKEDAFAYCTSLKEITMPQSVTSIGGSAFYECNSLKKVVLTENTSVIDDSTFRNCTALTDITIPEGVTRIGHNTFDGCSNLREITLPASLTKIDNNAFENCSSLGSVTILAEVPPQIPTSSWFAPFYGNSNNRKFYVPKNSVEAYKAQWSAYEESIEATE